jgi:hypothetical protein
MKKAHVWLGLCLLLGLAAFNQSTSAQTGPENEAMAGVGLAEAGEKARDALLVGDYRTLYALLDAPTSGQVALSRDKFLHLLDNSDMTDESAKEFAQDRDPRGELGITSVATLTGLTEEQFFGLTSGLLEFHTERTPEQLALRWHLVQRGVGMFEPNSWGRRRNMFHWGGTTTYANRADELISLAFTLERSEWKLADYRFEGKGAGFSFTDMIQESLKWGPDSFKWTSRERAMMVEGEQVLGSARDRARIRYATTGKAPAALSEFEELEAFAGKHYAAEDKVHLLTSESDAAVLVKPTGKARAWGLIRFKWSSGESTVEWFDTQADRDARLAKLKEKK